MTDGQMDGHIDSSTRNIFKNKDSVILPANKQGPFK